MDEGRKLKQLAIVVTLMFGQMRSKSTMAIMKRNDVIALFQMLTIFSRVEAKRKGVARVEAFLDMMSFKGNDTSNDERNDASSMSTTTSKATQNEEAKNSSTATSSSQSPSPPTFSSPSPEESMNRFQNPFLILAHLELYS